MVFDGMGVGKAKGIVDRRLMILDLWKSLHPCNLIFNIDD